MRNRGIAAAVLALGALVAGCGSGGAGGGAATVTAAAAPKAEKLGPDPGTRYTRVDVPKLDGMTCAKGEGGFHFGSDLDMNVFGVDGLPAPAGADGDDHTDASCFGNPRLRLSSGAHTATVPHFTARTKLFAAVADPRAALEESFEHTMKLSAGYGRERVGEARLFTTRALVVKCQHNVAATFPMTTCFWANYGAVGSIDFFPAGGEHLPLDQAAARTQAVAASALAAPGGGASAGPASPSSSPRP
ncbi:hypothetical protein [Kitasatospora sp. A2-31]|uniref:hypothetical protein n=2 Tax=Kitasatospora sp. A2-31 TaxID=2916414 RepID=UPI001EEE65A8|nr:hypothetical protein [Kitasatospora sp. A2-31]MCG6499616.1 hypothetical protein [Kitasatospora sp. A2-31]